MAERDPGLGRRDFMRAAATIIGSFFGAALGLPAIAFLISPSLRADERQAWVDLGSLNTYPSGIPTLFQFTQTSENGWERTAMSYGAFVVRRDESNVRVFSNICTHLGCRVAWHADIQNFVSPCHDGHFDILGRVVSGPPPRPLDEFETKVENGRLLIQIPALKRTS